MLDGYNVEMRRRGAYLAAALCALLATATGSDANISPARCPREHQRVLLADTQAQVYRGPPTLVGGCEVPGSAEVYGRLLAHGHAYLLGGAPWGTTEGVGGVANETLAGPVVAYERYREVFGPGEPRSMVVIVRDLRTGRVLHDTPIASTIPQAESFVSIVAKSDGAAAWIVETGYVGGYQVHAVDANGSRVLALGSGIEPRSLALAGNTLYWMQEGKPVSAALN
jgi:hypothetical protein